jgi:hypothetical protein
MIAVKELEKEEARIMNRDPISGQPGSHPVGTGVGAASGAIAGAVVGAIAGPIGAAIVGAVGAVAGGLVGRDAGETIHPTNGEVNWTDPPNEDTHWVDSYSTEPYVNSMYSYEDYAPAYNAAHALRLRHYDGSWDDAEIELQANWERIKGTSRLGWDEARLAAHAAWLRVERPMLVNATLVNATDIPVG